jgi:Skp family chaperone for outer membrane proteins
MSRAIATAGLFLVVAGCQLSPEARRTMPPLPSEPHALSYRDAVQRARQQAAQATEAFYIDQWTDVDAAAQGLEETARYLTRTRDIPAHQQMVLAIRSEDLAKAAQTLREAVKSRDERRTTEVMQRINLLVRQLRPE